MAYSYALPDTSTRNKLLGTANQFAGVDDDFARIKSAGRDALQQNFGAAQTAIGQQFSPMFRQAQSRLGANPLLGDSGYANRLNRLLQQNAFGQLSGAYGQAAADQSQNEVGALERLFGGRRDILAALLGTAEKKRGPGAAIGAGLGAVAGTLLAPGVGTGIGAQLGGSAGGYF